MTVGRSVRRLAAILLAVGLAWVGTTLIIDVAWQDGSVVYAQDEEDGADAENESDTAAQTPAENEAPEEMQECPPGLVALDFVEDMDIRLVVKTIARKLKKSLLLDKSIAGNITIVAPNRCMTPDAAFDIFLSVLHLNGLTTVQVGEVIKIIKINEAQANPIPTLTGGPGRSNERFITQLVPLQNIDAVEIATAFRSLVSGDGNIFAYGPSNMLIIMDSAANINRLIRILQKLDVEGSEQMIAVIPIEYASAEALADVIMQLFEDSTASASGSSLSAMNSAASSMAQSRASRLRDRLRQRPGGAAGGIRGLGGASPSISGGESLKILPDTRTNSLVVKGNKFSIKRVKEVVAKLDAPLPGGEGKIHVVYLENANAEELAAVLADLAGTGGYGGGGNAATASSRFGTRGSNSRAGNVSSAFNSRFGGSSRLGSTGGLGGMGGLGGSTGLGGGAMGGMGNPNRSIGQTTGRFMADFDGAVRITSDPATNSLVIIASNRDFEILREVINKLDIPRPQVFVEVTIAEITVERGLDVGFEFRSTNDTSEEGVQVIGGSNYGGIQSAAANPLGITGFALGAADGTLTFAGETFPNIGALFRALQNDRDVNILATPHLLTTDNEEAQIVIANNIPFITGQIFSSNFNNPTTTIERQDVGITMRIMPSINESEMVRLNIYQESSSVTDSPAGLSAAQVGITTAKRSADTVVVVRSRQTVVIGGLMQDNISYAEAKVPVLGDIPILGYLFKSSKKKVEKTNLLFFITPYIIKDTGDLEEVTRRANYRLQNFREQNRLPDRLDRPVENEMISPDRVFRRTDAEVIEIDPTQRGTSVRPTGDNGEDDMIDLTAPIEPNEEEQPAPQPVDDQQSGSDDGGDDGGGGDEDFGPGGGE